ncbi:hypothetical protein QBC34DRAFT_444210 [Podospora aff. communis PSN243]|uniref:NmrA-like domain-containing protein n=1 Tax=Podospora aff. communis PSN243 TaxID=3040156 RepID=A0AAV9G4K7_9PEZI|nr:hypothetical protein QBC34DRAFT_444210 [Podospora aff. communis PSN243]
MAQRYPSVALLGATGNIGPHLLQALREAQPPFKSITVLTRALPSPNTFPSGVTVKVVDYSSTESITDALAGVNAVVSALPIRSATLQNDVFDAAIEAGVKFFIPSEFGLASTDARINADFQNWKTKYDVAQRLEALKREGKIDGYALVFTGLFLDWGMEGIFLDLKNKRVNLWDEGNTPVSLTTVASIGKAVVGVLQGKVAKTEVRVKDINMSQRRLYELAEKVTSGEWTVTRWDTAEGVAAAEENIRRGVPDKTLAFLKRAVSLGGYGSVWGHEEDDSEALGLREWTEKEVVALIERMVEKK